MSKKYFYKQILRILLDFVLHWSEFAYGQINIGAQLKLKSREACGYHLRTASGQLRVHVELTCASW